MNILNAIKRFSRLTPILTLLASTAGAQNLNIDFTTSNTGCGGGVAPSNGYGAAAGQVGFWNSVNETALDQQLQDVAQGWRDVTISVANAAGGCPATGPSCGTWAAGSDDENLYRDRLVVPAATTVCLDNLRGGDYMLYVYTFDGGGFAHPTYVKVDPAPCSTSNPDSVDFAGAFGCGSVHAPGILGTYTVRSFTVLEGESITVDVIVADDASTAAINALQLVRTGPGPESVNYCEAVANSTGFPAIMGATGSSSVSNDDLVLTTAVAPPGQSAQYLAGQTPISVPFGNGGRLCVSSFTRLGAIFIDAAGTASDPVDLASLGVTAGQTWYFQLWYRDPAVGPDYFNTSDGLEVNFTF